MNNQFKKVSNGILIIIIEYSEILKLHLRRLQSMNSETKGHKGVIRNVSCHVPWIFNESELFQGLWA